MFCPKCGAENEEGAKFCRSCGANTTEGAAGQTPPPVETPPAGEAPPPLPAPKPAGKGKVDFRWVGMAFKEVTSDLRGYVVLGIWVGLLSIITFGILAGPLFAGSLWVIRRKLAGQGKIDIGEVFSRGFAVFMPSFLLVFLTLAALYILLISCVLPLAIMTEVTGDVNLVIGVPLYALFIIVAVASVWRYPFFAFALHYIIEEKMDFIPAGQAAFNVMKPDLRMLWSLGWINAFFAEVGYGFYIVPGFFTMPVSLVIMAYMLDSYTPRK